MSDPRQPAAIARRARTQSLRMRVLAIAVAIFLVAWLALYVQLVSGRDPALANDLRPVATQSADPQAAEPQSASGVTPDDSSAAAPAVTTGQS